MTYAPFGGISTLVNRCAGTGCVQRQETYDYNKRLQPVRIQVGSSSNTAGNSCLVYNYYGGTNPTSCAVPTGGTSGNNGNVTGYFYQDTTNPSLGHTASYQYDPLSRLTSAVATGSSTYNLAFTYDRWGNMSCPAAGSGCPQLSYDTNTNRVTKYVSQTFSYDAAGNLIQDGTGVGTHTYQWDAEGRLGSVDNGSTASYVYNALGWRVHKVLPGNYQEIFYDGYGNVSAYRDNVTWRQIFVLPVAGREFVKYINDATYFLHGNHLGSTGLITDQTAGTVQDQLYYPWGQLWAGAGGPWDVRFASLGQRDAEIDFNPTPFRLYSDGYGRWASPVNFTIPCVNPKPIAQYADGLVDDGVPDNL